MRICGKAVELDPNYADAWALLAIAQSSLRYTFDEQIDDGFAAANAALSIDPTIAEAYCPLAHRLFEQQRLSDAVTEIEKALRLDPDSWEVNKEAGRLALAGGRIADAAGHYAKAAEVMESDFHAWAMLVTCLRPLGDDAGVKHAAERMISESKKALAEDPSNGAALGIAAGGLAISGQHDRARESIERAMLLDPDNNTMRYNFACVLATHMADNQAALSLLSSTLMRSKVHCRAAITDPDLDGLRNEPAFLDLLERATKRHGIAAMNAD